MTRCSFGDSLPGERAGLGSNTLLETSISEETVGEVVEDLETVLVVDGTHVSLGNGETDSVSDTLTEGTGGDLDTVSDTDLGVTGGDGVDLSEVLEVIHGELVATEVEQDVLEDTTDLLAEILLMKARVHTRDRWRERIGLGSTTWRIYR